MQSSRSRRGGYDKERRKNRLLPDFRDAIKAAWSPREGDLVAEFGGESRTHCRQIEIMRELPVRTRQQDKTCPFRNSKSQQPRETFAG
jgi:hypothetical protein